MSDSEHDDDFEAYLKRRVPIDQRMKNADRLEPPPELDRIIIGKARNAIQSSPNVPLYRAPKWALPVGLAATFLIAFSIVLDLGIRSARQHLQAAPAVAQAPAAASAPEPMAAPAPAQAVPSSDSAPQQPTPSRPSAATGSSSAAASAKAFARMRPPPIKTAPWPPIRRAEKPAAPSGAASAEYATATASAAEFDARSRSAERRVAEKRLRTDDSERVAAAADVGSPAAQDAAPAAAAGGSALRGGSGGLSEAVPVAGPAAHAASAAPAPLPRVASAAAAPVPVPAAPPPRPLVDATANAEAPAPLRLAASSPKVSASTFDGAKVIEPRSVERFDSVSGSMPAARAAAPAVIPSAAPGPAATPAAAAVPAAASVAGGSTAAASSTADRRDHPDPKVWLDQIQKMRVAGLTAQAEQELKHFRDAYPAYPTGSPDGGTQ